MKLSEELKQNHECGDHGEALEGLWEKAKGLEDSVDDLTAIVSAIIKGNETRDGGQFASYWGDKLKRAINK